jgi:hypothetical protein
MGLTVGDVANEPELPDVNGILELWGQVAAFKVRGKMVLLL